MKFDIENSRDYRKFGEVGNGEVFLDDDGYPYIKIPDVHGCDSYDVYNCIRLTSGNPSHFYCDKQVCIPIDCAFKIKI